MEELIEDPLYSEPLGEKPCSVIDGIGEEANRRLEAIGYDKVVSD